MNTHVDTNMQTNAHTRTPSDAGHSTAKQNTKRHKKSTTVKWRVFAHVLFPSVVNDEIKHLLYLFQHTDSTCDKRVYEHIYHM